MIPIKFRHYYIGYSIKYTKCYSIKCSERFTFDDGEGHKENSTELVPLKLNGTGELVGIKRALMTNYKYHKGYTIQGFEDSYPEGVRTHVTGNYEWCIICVDSINKFKPYLVRVQDIIQL